MNLRWIWVVLLVVSACGFPRPQDLGDDVAGSCQLDDECSGTTPFCADGVCAVCKASASCPAARPVCDQTSHDCRSCAKDSECDSGACDLAAGTCVDQGAVLYASPGGTRADACTRAQPCSLERAAELVNETRAYVVLQPGHHLGGAVFRGKKATIVGDDASIDLTDASPHTVDILDGSFIVMRNFAVNDTTTPGGPASDIGSLIYGVASDVTIENMRSSTQRVVAVSADRATLRHSEFSGHAAVTATTLVADACVFHTQGPGILGSAEISNSVIFADSGQTAIAFYKPTSSVEFATNIHNNTFVGGSIYCDPTNVYSQTFDSNIFYNLEATPQTGGRRYQYNLTSPSADLGGVGNLSGDPLFVDLANQDLHLRAGSPAIDAGNPASTSLGRDLDGRPRPQGARPDMGAFEYVPPP